MVVIIDYNVGNVKSVLNALNRIGLEAIVSRNVQEIKKANGIILPGVGSFPVAMENLKKYGLIEVLDERKKAEIPILGICLGMQILFQRGFEVKETEGLKYLSGNVRLININKKLPHMGWNQLFINKESEILKYISEEDDVYFVHSFMADFIDEEVICYTEYGNVRIPAIAQKENIIGCQFHPEKSGKVGEKILKAWKELVIC